jgi:hypothetical protein
MSSLPVTSRAQGPERRRHVRCRVLERQLVTVGLGQNRRGLLVDLSESGAAVQPYTELQAGESSVIEFKLPGSSETVEARGVVNWVGPNGRAGIEFIHVPEQSFDRLRRWIDNATTAPAPSTGAALGTAAYLPPSYSPWIRTSEMNLAPSRLHDDEVADLDLVSALRLVVERSRTLARASGAAIALADQDDMVCRARTGVAPDLGARFHPDSGLSGEAVRTGEVVRCSDASEDPRVDRIACERLNVRSIVVTPILAGSAVIGVIEVFSPKIRAFDEHDEKHIRRMADLIGAMLESSIDPRVREGMVGAAKAAPGQTAHAPEQSAEQIDVTILDPTVAGTESQAARPAPSTESPDDVPQPEIANSAASPDMPPLPGAARVARSEATESPHKVQAGFTPSAKQVEEIYKDFMEQASEEDRRRRNKTLAIVLGLMLLVTGALSAPYWLPRKKPPVNAAPHVAPPVQSQPSQDLEQPPAAAPQPSAPASKPAPKARKTDTPARGEHWSFTAPTKPGTGSELKLESPDIPTPESAPEVTRTSGQVRVISDMVGTWPADASASDSRIVGGKLITRVDPIFPLHVNHTGGARERVVLRIGIDKDGHVSRTDAVSGDPTLVAAAEQAIKQWRYEPFQLDGQPIAVEKTITIDFGR